MILSTVVFFLKKKSVVDVVVDDAVDDIFVVVVVVVLFERNDVRTMSTVTRKILTNKYAIAVNQDPLGHQATVVQSDNTTQVQNMKFTKLLLFSF